jgi:carboxypeptidase PM20D1
MRRWIAAPFALALLVVSIAAFRAVRLAPEDEPVTRVTTPVDEAGAVARLQGAIRIPTTVADAGPANREPFLQLHGFLQGAFPLVHARLARETSGDLSLVYRWKGKNPALGPVVLMGHLDVVPIAPGTEGDWTHPPFSAERDGDWIYGRGTLDDKSTVLAALESVEGLLKSGFTPERDLLLQFGHDEEIGGREGARVIVEKLVREGVKPALVLDEGGALTSARRLGVPGLMAMIGFAEKGFVSLELRVAGDGGHSSTPPSTTHIGRVARAVSRLESNPFPASLDGPAVELFDALAPHTPFARRIALANLWLFGPLVTRALLNEPATAAMLRTTTAPTIFEAGNKANVLPPTARAVVNFRIRPGETVASVTEAVKRIVADDAVAVEPVGFSVDPSHVSDIRSPAYAAVRRTIRETLGSEPPLVLPYLVMGGTDARYWSPHAPTFRFNPFPMEEDVMKRAHGTDERISVAGYVNGVRFYERLIRNAQAL